MGRLCGTYSKVLKLLLNLWLCVIKVIKIKYVNGLLKVSQSGGQALSFIVTRYYVNIIHSHINGITDSARLG